MFASNIRYNPSHVVDCCGVPILKGSAIYGANAGGKTSFVSGLATSQKIIVYGINAQGMYSNLYCRLHSENKDKETYFEYMFENEGKCYYYGFEIILSKSEIVREWLIGCDPKFNIETIIFERDETKQERFVWGDAFSGDEKRRLNIYADDLLENKKQLLLTEMSSKKLDKGSKLAVFGDVYGWFSEKLFVNRTDYSVKERFLKSGAIMDGLDTDVNGFKIVDLDNKDSGKYDMVLKIGEQLLGNSRDEVVTPGFVFSKNEGSVVVQEICTTHKSCDSTFHYDEESKGTVDVLKMIPILITEHKDATFIMDDYGSSMHTLLAYQYIEYFQNSNVNTKNQLVVATHHTSLMSLDLYRRDEIWFVDKSSGESELYSLGEFAVRSDGKKIDKAYLEGRFGALPVFKKLNWVSDDGVQSGEKTHDRQEMVAHGL